MAHADVADDRTRTMCGYRVQHAMKPEKEPADECHIRRCRRRAVTVPPTRRRRRRLHSASSRFHRPDARPLPLLRLEASAVRHLDGFSAPSGDGADRPVGLRQVDAPALPEPHERPDRRRLHHRQHPSGRRGGQRSGPGRDRTAPPGRHGVPEGRPVPQVDLRERRLRPADRRHPRPAACSTRRWRRASAARRCGTK